MKFCLVTDQQQDLSHNILCERLIDILQSLGLETNILQCKYVEDIIINIETSKPDLVFTNQSYFEKHTGGQIISHDVFENCNVAYIGSQPKTLDLLLHKASLKDHWHSHGISTPEYRKVTRNTFTKKTPFEEIADLQNYPYIIKPNNAGNSSGIDQSCIVDDLDQLMRVIIEKLEIYSELLVEKFLGDDQNLQEFTVAQIGSDQCAIFLPVEIRLVTSETRRLITTGDKDLHGTETVPVTGVIRDRLIEFSRKAFQSAGVRDYGRLDVLSTQDGFSALEINGQPMIPDRWFEGCAQGAGMNETQYMAAILHTAAERWNRTGIHNINLPEAVQEIIPPEIIKLIRCRPVLR